ncbi:MAG: hypothetical protein PVS2B2_20230 [Candidatus Acidiferrum sp.]
MKKSSVIQSVFYFLTLACLLQPSAVFASGKGHKDIDRTGNRHENNNSQNENLNHEDNSGNTPVNVPEPATMTLLGVGLVGVVAQYRSRNR